LKAVAQRRAGWVFGFQDEVWFSRLAQPALHSWTPAEALRLHAKAKDAKAKDAKAKDAKAKDAAVEPEALACYGLLRADTQEMLLRFVKGRPVSGVTIAFLEWLTTILAHEGQRVLVMAWDNARWHTSGAVKEWIKAHNQRLKKQEQRGEKAGCRLLVCPLPVKSPWLNAIEPKWMHGKRNIVEPQRKLSSAEVRQRLCDYYKTPLLPCIRQ
jgi:hypothetical protein